MSKKQVRGSDSPVFTVEALASVLDPRLITETLRKFDRETKRNRKLPAQLVAWLVVGMALFRSLSIVNVLRRLADGLGMPVAWKSGAQTAPSTAAITKARDRLGFEVMRSIFRDLADSLREKHDLVNRWRGHPVYALDGTTLATPDTKDNVSWFGRPKGSRGSAGFPQLRCVVLAAAFSRLVVAAAFWRYDRSELTIAQHLLDQIGTGAVVLMDRLYYAYATLVKVRTDRAAHFVVRAKTGRRVLKPRRLKKLGDADWLGYLPMPTSLKRYTRTRAGLPDSLEVRIIKYRRKGFPPSYLVTSLLDPVAYPASELVDLYHVRWEVELCYDEVKTHFVKKKVVFRSKRPERVLQEAYGLLIAYNCIRALMAQAAGVAKVEPRQLGFTDSLERIRRSTAVMGLAPAACLPMLYERLVADLANFVLPRRRTHRVFPRAVKVKMSSYPLKRNQNGRGRRPRKRAA